MKERFPKETLQIYGLTCLLPSFLTSSDFTDEVLESQITAISAKYWPLFASSERSFGQMLEAELKLWRKKWARVSQPALPKDVMGAFNECDSFIFPLISVLLQILATIPITTCSAERSFSTLRRLKTYLRSTMKAHRLTGLALINIHREIKVDARKVLERFMQLRSRRKLWKLFLFTNSFLLLPFYLSYS